MTNSELGFQAQIYSELVTFPDRIKFPDRSNMGKRYALLMLWKRVEQLAGKQYEALMGALVEDNGLVDPKSIDIPGDHVIGDAGKISVTVNVSKPRREFNADWLAQKLYKDYEIPVATVKALIEEAKRPGKTQIRRITVAEKGTAL